MNWRTVAISEVSNVVTGSTPKTNRDDFFCGDIPFVTPAELEQATPIVSTPRTLSMTGAQQVRLVPPNAILVCCIGSLGKVGIAGRTLATNQQINAIVFDESKVWPRFGYYACRLLKPTLENMAPATTVAIVSKSKFQALEIPLPPLEEQKRIAAILDQADELRRKRQRALDRLNQLGQAIFIEMFGEWDRPGANADTLQLGDHIDFLTSGSRGWAEYYSDAGGLFLRIQNVRRDELDLSDVAYVNAPATAEANRTRVQPGDVLLSITADLGRTAVVPEDIGEAYINQHLAIIRAKRFDPRFLSAALSSPSGQRLILKRNREGVKAGLNFDDVRSVLIPDVGAEREQEYGARAKAVDCLKQSALAALAETEKLFASLQHRAFRGEFTASSLKKVAA